MAELVQDASWLFSTLRRTTQRQLYFSGAAFSGKSKYKFKIT
jgi:hypothetical protein